MSLFPQILSSTIVFSFDDKKSAENLRIWKISEGNHVAPKTYN